MRVLIVPSWYPYPENPLAGNFFLKQAIALAKYTPHDYTILNFGQNEFQFGVRQPVKSLQKRSACKNAFRGTRIINSKLTELCLPFVSYSSRFRNGNLDSFDISQISKHDLILALVSFPGGYLARRIAKEQGIPYIISEHSGPFPLADFARKNGIAKSVKQSLADAAALTAVSTFTQSQMQKYVEREIQVIPNAVDSSFFVPQDFKPAKPRIFSMMPFTAAKGAEELLVALKLAKAKGLDFKVQWSGEGPLKKRIMRKAQDLDIRFTGFLSKEEALLAYQKCSFYVMPSRVESFSIVLIEALSCGKPIVAADCGGPRDIVQPNVGILAKSHKANDLAAAILQMAYSLNDFDAHRIRQYAISRFSEETVCRQWTDMLNQSLALP